jgi:mono/diheme cytochrome c family protein
VLLHGTQNVATATAPTGPSMPAFGWKLTDPQAAAVLTYIRNSWGNAAPAVDARQVNKLRSPSG